MAKTETSVTELRINTLTKEKYDSIATPSNTELYFVKDELIDYNDLINTPNLATVATSGSYNDLLDKPSSTSQVISGSNDLLTSGGAYTNLISDVVSGETSNKINIIKAGNVSTITIDNVLNSVTSQKLGSTTVGSNIQPIYINNGNPVAIEYTISKSVPADAKFTDTTYNEFIGATSTVDGSSGLVKKPTINDRNKFLKGNGNWEYTPIEVEWAEYNTTTYQQIIDWVNSGIIVFTKMQDNTMIYVLSDISDDCCTFISYSALTQENTTETLVSVITVSSENIWENGSHSLQRKLPAETAGQVVTYTGVAGEVTSTTLSTVATTGSYSDLLNKPVWTYDEPTETLTIS